MDDLDDNPLEGSMLDHLECSICMEMMNDIVIVRSVEQDGFCNHSFCKDCLDSILKNAAQQPGKKAECPNCRRQIIGYERNALAMEMRDTVLKYKAMFDNQKASKPAEDPESQKQIQLMIDELQNKLANERKKVEEALEALQKERELVERYQKEHEARESEITKVAQALKQQEARNDAYRQREAEFQKQIDAMAAKDSEKGRLLAGQLQEQRLEAERGRKLAEALEHQLHQQRLAADQLSKQTEEKQKDLEVRYAKMHQQLLTTKKKLAGQRPGGAGAANANAPAEPGSPKQNPRGLGASSLAGSVVLGSILQSSPFRWITSRISTAVDATKALSSYIWKDYSGALVQPKKDFEMIESRGNKRKSCVWKATQIFPDPSSDPKNPKRKLRALKRLPIPPYVPPSPVVPDPNAANIPPAQPISEDKKLASRYETEYSRSYDFYAAFREPMLLAAIRHPCVVKLYGIIREAEQYFEVLQFVDEDLQFALEDKPLSLQDAQRVMYHLLLAVDYLHRNDIVHRNLSTRSVMVTPSLANKNNQAAKKQKIGAGGRNQPPGPTIQLACFGNARSLQPPYPKHIMEDAIHAMGASEVKHIDPSQPIFEPLPDAEYNMVDWAPELICKELLDVIVPGFNWKKIDMYSVGLIGADILRQGRKTFSSRDPRALLDEILSISDLLPKNQRILSYLPIVPPRAQITLKDHLSCKQCTPKQKKLKDIGMGSPEDPDNIKGRAIDLISKLLAFDPAERFSAREALAHPFFDELFVAGNMENLDTRDIKFDVTDDKLIEFVEKSCGGIPK